MLNYLAYGSNLHPLRLTERVPSARLRLRLFLPGYRVVFNKQGQDGSAKCNLEPSDPNDQAYAALYEIAPHEKALLDSCEGCGCGYRDISLSLQADERGWQVFTYLAEAQYIDASLKPFAWYRDLVVAGADYLAFPGNYSARLGEIETLSDSDRRREADHRELLQRIRRVADPHPLPALCRASL